MGGAEENYKRLKQWVEIGEFSGKSVLSVKQDFYAKVLSTNLTAMIANALNNRSIRQRPIANTITKLISPRRFPK